MATFLGALPPDQAAILRDFLTHQRGARPAPWCSWALRLLEHFGVALPERAAAALALLMTPGFPATQTSLAVELLEGLGLGRADVGAVVLDATSLAPPLPACPGAERLEDAEIPRKLALLWGLAALVARHEPGPWVRFAASLAEPVALLFGLIDIADGSAGERARAEPPRLGAVLRACVGSHEALAAVRLACAGSMDPSGSLVANSGAVVANPATLIRLEERRKALLDGARALLPAQGPTPGEAFLVALECAFSALDAPLWVRAIASTALRSSSWHVGDAEGDVRAAIGYLRETRPWRAAWNVHRFQAFGAQEMLVGRIFLQGLVLLSLSEMGVDEGRAISALLNEIPAGDARYYSGWSGLPPDVDTLRLLMQLAARIEAPPRERVESWIALLEPSLDEHGVAPTWLERGPEGRKCTLAGPFLGDDCTAVRLALLLGCACYDAQRFEPILRSNLRSVMGRLRGGAFEGCVHYTASFARYLFFLLERELLSRAPAVARDLAVSAAAAELRADLLRSQQVDGGWGSPQETALALTALSIADVARAERRWAMKHLSETQAADGSWPAEPFYITPGKRGGMTPLARKEVTTALCARALRSAIDAERRHVDRAEIKAAPVP